MTKFDMELFTRMSDASRRFVAIWISQNDLPETTIEMEDTPSGLRVTYYVTDDDGRLEHRFGTPVTATMLVPNLELPWEPA